MVSVAQLVEPRVVIPVVVGSSPIAHPITMPAMVGSPQRDDGMSVAKVAELVDALDLGSSGATRESSSLSFRTSPPAGFRPGRRMTGIFCSAAGPPDHSAPGVPGNTISRGSDFHASDG